MDTFCPLLPSDALLAKLSKREASRSKSCLHLSTTGSSCGMAGLSRVDDTLTEQDERTALPRKVAFSAAWHSGFSRLFLSRLQLQRSQVFTL